MGDCYGCGRKFRLMENTYTTYGRDLNTSGKICKECFNDPYGRIPDKHPEKGQEDKICTLCKENVYRIQFSNFTCCMKCFTHKFGKFLRSHGGLYYGGHKAILAGGLMSENEGCDLFLTSSHFLARKKGKWDIVIPFNKMQMEHWKVDEKSRRTMISGLGGNISSNTMMGGGIIQEQGKRHNIVLPYVDENGILQEPRFGIPSLGGKAIREWASDIYQLFVKNIQENPVDITNDEKPVTESDPIKILKIRYAKGEITKEEFDKIKEDLE